MAALSAAVVLYACFGGSAWGERNQHGNLIVALDGAISPVALPRHEPAPVTITVSSRLSSADGSLPPRARRIELAFPDRGVSFGGAGLPTCPLGRIRNTTSALALARCGPALVGHGRLRADLLLPHQRPLHIGAGLLAFNGRTDHGGAAVWAHAYSTRPPTAFVLPFVAHRVPGGFPNALTAVMPRSVRGRVRLRGFRMTLGRRYREAGIQRSYLNAFCPAPPHFTAGFFYLARVTYTFARDRRIGNAIVRACRVRK